MVLDTITNNLRSLSSKYPTEFNKIIDCFSSDYKLNESNIKILWKAYNVGHNAHKGQKRSSGGQYFDHCIEVSKQLINWNMDIRSNNFI